MRFSGNGVLGKCLASFSIGEILKGGLIECDSCLASSPFSFFGPEIHRTPLVGKENVASTRSEGNAGTRCCFGDFGPPHLPGQALKTRQVQEFLSKQPDIS
jgi:hypothetical protein